MSTENVYSFDSAVHTCKIEVWQNDHCILEHTEVVRLRFGSPEKVDRTDLLHKEHNTATTHFKGELAYAAPRFLNAIGMIGYDLRSQTVPFDVKIFAYDPISNQDYVTTLLGCWGLSFEADVVQFSFVSQQSWRPLTIFADSPQKKQARWWSGGNLPKLNALQNRLEAMQQAFRITTDYSYVEPGLAVVPRLRTLCDCAKVVVDLYGREDTNAVAAAVCALRVAWERLDSDRPAQAEETVPCVTT